MTIKFLKRKVEEFSNLPSSIFEEGIDKVTLIKFVKWLEDNDKRLPKTKKKM